MSPSPTESPSPSPSETPTAGITSPTDGAQLTGNVTITVNAAASVTRAELYVDGSLNQTSTTPPFSFTWNASGVPEGNHTLQTKGYDGSGNSWSSSIITVASFWAPRLILTAPKDGATVDGSQLVDVSFSLVSPERPLVPPTRLTLMVNGSIVATIDNPTSWPQTFHFDAHSFDGQTIALRGLFTDSAGLDLLSNIANVHVTGGNPPPPTVSVTLDAPVDGASVSGVVNLQASASTNQGTITQVDFFVDNQLVGTDTTAPYAVAWDTTNVPTGTHQIYAKATASWGGTATSSPVHNVTVTRGGGSNPPTVFLINPADGSIIGGTVTLLARATDDTGVASVAFYLDQPGQASKRIGTVASSPYQLDWDTHRVGAQAVTDGLHVIYAVATDIDGNPSAPNSHSVTIDNTLPTVAILSPTNDATVSGTITVHATANDAHLDKVALFVDGVQQGGSHDATPPFDFTLDTRTLTNGAHTLSVTALDLAGNTQTAAITIHVNNVVDTTPPTVSLTAPSNGATVGGLVTISASASDNVGVDHVEFYVDGTLLSTDNSSPYSALWDTSNLSNASHDLMARAYDAAGNHADSPTVTVTVFNDHRPLSVTFTTPDTDGKVIGGPGIAMQVSWTGMPNRLEFYVNGALVNTTYPPANQAMYLPPAHDADYTLMAKVTDATGATASTTLTVHYDVTAPTISNFSLHNNQNLSGTVTITATASDTHLAGMDLVAWTTATGDHVIFSDPATPTSHTLSYTLDTTTMADGQYRFKIRAHDVVGNANEQFVDLYIDNNPPTYARVSPADNSNWPKGKPVPFVVNATDAGSGMYLVKISIDGSVWLQMTQVNGAGPYSYTEPTTTANFGRHNFTIIAQDISGKTVTDQGYYNIVHDVTAPTVQITAPAANATVAGVLIDVHSVGQDDVGVSKIVTTITGPAFYNFQHTDWSADSDWYWNIQNIPTGDYTISVQAFDDAGNIGTASELVHVISDHTPPTVSIASPSNGANVAGGGTPLLIHVNATDDVRVASVGIYAGKSNTLVSLTSKTSGPWDFSLDSTNLDGSDQTYWAVAYDEAGNSAVSQPVTVHFSGTSQFQVHLLNVRDGWSYAGVVTVGSIWPGLPFGLTPTYSALFVDGHEWYSAQGQVQLPWDTRRFAEGPHTLRWEGVLGNGTFSSETINVFVDNSGATPNYPPNLEVRTPGAGGIIGGIAFPASAYADSPRWPYAPTVIAKIDGVANGMNNGNSGHPVVSVLMKTTLFPNGAHQVSMDANAGDYPQLVAHSPNIPITISNTIRLTSPEYDGQTFIGQGIIMMPITAHLYYANGYAKVEIWAEQYNGSKTLLSSQNIQNGVNDYGATLTITSANLGQYVGVWAYAIKTGHTTPDDLDRDVRYVHFGMSSGGNGGGGGFGFGSVRLTNQGDYAADNVTLMTPTQAKAISDAAETTALDATKVTAFQTVYVAAAAANAVNASLITGSAERISLSAVPDAGGLGSFTLTPGLATVPLVFSAAGLTSAPADLQLLRIDGDQRSAVAVTWLGGIGFADVAPGSYVIAAAPARARVTSLPLSVKIGSNPSAHPVIRVVASSDVHINIFDEAGQLVTKVQLSPAPLDNGESGVLYTLDEASGGYIVRAADSSGQTIVKKVVVVR